MKELKKRSNDATTKSPDKLLKIISLPYRFKDLKPILNEQEQDIKTLRIDMTQIAMISTKELINFSKQINKWRIKSNIKMKQLTICRWR